jgi:hypothetical protein
MEKFQARSSCNIYDVCRVLACIEALGQVMWLKKFIPDLRIVDCIKKPLRLYCDNNKSTNATKPIEVMFYALKDRVHDQTSYKS